jgi:hypothetical protein
MSCEVTDTPQWAPGVITGPTNGDSGSLPVTINKLNAMNSLSKASSRQPGRDAAYAVDNSSGTWWEPIPTDTLPSLTIELSPATEFDVVQLFTIDGIRLMFNGGRRGFGRPPTTPAPEETSSGKPLTEAYQYKLEVSMDGKTFTTALDQTGNNIQRNTIFEEIPPVQCRFVRLTMTNWPRTTPLGIIECTVFGKASGSLPAKEPIPGTN